MVASVALRGVVQMVNNLRNFQRRFPDRVAAALYQEAQIEKTEAQKRTPVLTGALRASALVLKPTRHGRSISVTITFGNVSIGYAVYVHENLDAYHHVGQAKFLESVLKESAPYMLQRVAARLGLGKAESPEGQQRDSQGQFTQFGAPEEGEWDSGSGE